MTKKSDLGEQKTPCRMRGWVRALFVVSLTLNLLVVGLVAGAHFREGSDARRFPPPDRNAMMGTGFAPFFDALPRELRRELGTELRERGAATRPNPEVLAAEFRSLLDVLRAEPFEATALEALLTNQHDRTFSRIAVGREAMVSHIAGMDAAERAEYADRLERRFRHGGNRR